MSGFHLERFVQAQAGVYEHARDELRSGRKRTHWMWFIFPQIHGLGSSGMSVRFAISGLEEAQAYLRHPLLGPRLIECTSIVCALPATTAGAVFGSPDDLKFHSSLTLFAHADESGLFAKALDLYFEGAEDEKTLQLLHSLPNP